MLQQVKISALRAASGKASPGRKSLYSDVDEHHYVMQGILQKTFGQVLRTLKMKILYCPILVKPLISKLKVCIFFISEILYFKNIVFLNKAVGLELGFPICETNITCPIASKKTQLRLF